MSVGEPEKIADDVIRDEEGDDVWEFPVEIWEGWKVDRTMGGRRVLAVLWPDGSGAIGVPVEEMRRLIAEEDAS